MDGARWSHVFVRAPEAGKPVRAGMAWVPYFQLASGAAEAPAACKGSGCDARADNELPGDPEAFASRMNHNLIFQELLK